MDELINLVAKKTGLSKEDAKMATETVIGFLKKKLPAPLAGQIDNMLSGADVTEDLTKMLGGLLGK